jgi:hypothetical protein
MNASMLSPARSFAALRMTTLALLLTACGSSGVVVKPQILTPPPSSPRSEFFVEKTEIQSRETGSEAWQRNEVYARLVQETLKASLRDRGKAIVPPPGDVVRSRVYLAYGAAPVKTKDRRRAKAHVEIRLQLLDGTSGGVLYTTHTLVPVDQSVLSDMGWGPEADQVIREILEKAALDFTSRL